MTKPFFQIDSLLQIVDRLHSAEGGVQALVDLANGLSAALDGALVAMARWQEHPLERAHRIVTGHDPRFDEIYRAHFPERIPWLAGLLEHAGEFYEIGRDLDEQTMVETSFYRSFMAPQGLAPLAVMGSRHLPDLRGPGFGWIVFGRRDFLPEEVRFCRRLDPHLARASRNAGQRLLLQHRLERDQELMDYAPVGLIYVDSGGELAWMNRMARSILEEDDVLGLREGRLVTRDEPSQAALAHAMRDMIEDRRKFQVVPVPRTGQRPLGVVLVGRPKAPVLPRGEPIGTIAILDPERISQVDDGVASHTAAPLLRKLYGLTEAEARLAFAIASGATPQDVAERSNRSLETIRTQLKGVFRKLGVSRQTDLVRVLGPTMVNQEAIPASWMRGG